MRGEDMANQTQTIIFRVTPQEKEAISRVAAQIETTVSQLLRGYIIALANKFLNENLDKNAYFEVSLKFTDNGSGIEFPATIECISKHCTSDIKSLISGNFKFS